MKMHCVDETKSQTIFAGTIKVPSDTDFNKLTNIPLYLIDSKKVIIIYSKILTFLCINCYL